MIRDYLAMAVQNFRERRLRSWLTMIGIFIGITAVVAIISLGQGLGAAIDEQFEALGVDKIFVQPGGSAFGGATAVVLDEDDRDVIARVQGVRDTIGLGYQNARIGFKDELSQGLVIGYTLEDEDLWRDMMVENLGRGRLLEQGDSFKAVVGSDHAEDDGLWERGVRLGDKITINGQDFDVVGIQEPLGNSADDQAVHISDDAYERVFDERLEDDYRNIVARSAQGADPGVVADRVEKELRDHRGRDVGDEDFTIQTTEEFMGSFNSILLIVNVVIIGIAAISLLIGGIGIMNTMYTAVVERTQEIGIMKAIGARNRDVLLLFLIESGLLGLVGGLIGVAAGLGISYLVEVFGAAALGTPYIRFWWSPWLVFGAVSFSVLLGALSGLAPAYQASRKSPVDSLRYE